MSQKAVTIYTPASADPHITADDDAFIYDSLLGNQSGILGSLTCEKVDDNTVRLSGGGASNQGYIIRIPVGESEDLTITSGGAGTKRYDLIVAEFIKGGGDVADTHLFKVVTGTASTSPSDPALITSAINNTGDINQVALFRVVLDGTTISTIEQLAVNASQKQGRTITTGATEPTNPSKGDIWFVTE